MKYIAGLVIAALTAATLIPVCRADEPATKPAALDPKSQAAVDQAKADIAKALDWLKTQQKPDHGWAGDREPVGITGLVIKCYLQAGVDPDTDFLDKALDNLVAHQQATGGIYTDVLASYNTAIAISALAAAPNEAELKEPRRKAIEFLKSLQWTDSIQGLPSADQPNMEANKGGFGYGGGKNGRADGSNTSLALDALHDAGVPSDDPAYKNALEFWTKLQNNSETNPGKNVGNDGGGTYSNIPGVNAAGEYTDASGNKIRRSYGSMTYAMLKSFIYCGLTKDDPRVKAAWGWITKHWSLDENPGLAENDPKTAKNGMFYYYHTLARALRAYGQPVITDAQGDHDWRLELIAKLTSLQKEDGHYVGYDKWMEGNPIITTSFAVLALQEAMADLQDRPAK